MLAQQWLEKLNDQWELQRFLQDCHEVGCRRTGCAGSTFTAVSAPVKELPGRGAVVSVSVCEILL